MDTFVNLGVRELRAGLAGVIARAAAGQRTVVTKDGRPVAQVAPLDEGAPIVDALIASGGLVAPRRNDEWRPSAPIAVWAGARIDQALREIRG